MLTTPAALEALLFASGEPVEKKRLANLLQCSATELETTIEELSQILEGRGLTLTETDDALELRTASEAADYVTRLRENERARDLGKGSMETLAVIAYQSGATRSDIDWVRGVNSTASLRTLLMRGLIEASEDPHDKRRLRYTLTTDALAHLGIRSAAELPRAEELALKTQEALKVEPESDASEEVETTA